MNTKQLKILGYVVGFVLILNIVLFSFTVISWKVFWVVIILGAGFVYLVLPKMKK